MQHFFSLRKLRLSLLSLFVVTAPLLPVFRAVAQQSKIATADIPFDFMAGSGKLPAGRYEIVRASENRLLLRSADFTHIQNVGVNYALSATLPDHGRLVFHRYGNRYYLADLWVAGTRTGLQLVKSRGEKELLSSVTKPPTTAPPTEIALNDSSH